MDKKLKHISKLMSLVLRHQPEFIGLKLDVNGWANVAEMIQKMNDNGFAVDEEIIATVVETNEKKRFAFDEHKANIKANQGHSITIDLNLPQVAPPAILFHGTATKNVESIFKKGIQKRARHHVHLSADYATALAVGTRHGKPIILTIDAAKMHQAGHQFYLSENNVWLVDEVPTPFISVMQDT